MATSFHPPGTGPHITLVPHVYMSDTFGRYETDEGLGKNRLRHYESDVLPLARRVVAHEDGVVETCGMRLSPLVAWLSLLGMLLATAACVTLVVSAKRTASPSDDWFYGQLLCLFLAIGFSVPAIAAWRQRRAFAAASAQRRIWSRKLLQMHALAENFNARLQLCRDDEKLGVRVGAAVIAKYRLDREVLGRYLKRLSAADNAIALLDLRAAAPKGTLDRPDDADRSRAEHLADVSRMFEEPPTEPYREEIAAEYRRPANERQTVEELLGDIRADRK